MRDTDEIYCWGWNEEGQLGIGYIDEWEIVPKHSASANSWNSVSAGRSHSCAVEEESDQAWCWGRDSSGQLGNGGPADPDQSSPVRVAGTYFFTVVVAGGTHTCGITFDGKAYCWGSNSRGQLGTGDDFLRYSPEPVAGGLSFVVITAGVWHTCGINANGGAYCWGNNEYGELGNNTTGFSKEPVPVLFQ